MTDLPAPPPSLPPLPSPPLPRIDSVLCSGCERCVEICPVGALAQVNGKALLLHPERCTYCALCEELCPDGAIALPFLIVFAASQTAAQPD